MNIYIIVKYDSPPKYNRRSSRSFYLAKELLKFGHQVTLITSDSNHLGKFPDSQDIYNYEIIEEVKLCWVKTKKYSKTASMSRVLSWLDFVRKLFKLNVSKMDRPDVVMVSTLPLSLILYGYYLKKKFNAFLIFDVRDIWPLVLMECGNFSKYHPLVLLQGVIEKFGYKKADLITGTMPKLDLHVKSVLGYNKPFFCLPLGFNPDNYKEDFLNKKNPFEDLFPKDKTIVGYSGSMGTVNGLDGFIESVKLLQDNPNIYFMIVGSGDFKKKFENKLIDCKNVTFLSRIEQNQVKYFLQKCDILYLSTVENSGGVWQYGQSMNKIVEYMLAAKIILVSYPSIGFQSMVNEANCGKFVEAFSPIDIKNAILDMVNMDPKDREKLGNNGRKWIYENRQYSKLAEEYIDAIMSIKQKQKD